MTQRPIIIDCDPGHDDALALMLAAAYPEKLKILGITTVGGNETLDKITINALKLTELLQIDVPIARGAADPFIRKLETAGDVHGDSGMDGPEFAPPQRTTVDQHAVRLMADIIAASEYPVTLVPLGPLTNIALLLSVYPEVKQKIECISLMGGGLRNGNYTAAAEFNIYVDPESADVVFRSGIPIIMSGLDVTEKAVMLYDEMERLRQRGTISRIAGEMLDFYSIYSKQLGQSGSPLHDPCAVAWLLAPDLFETEDYWVEIETQGSLTRGMTIADRRPGPIRQANVKVLLDVDRGRFIALLFEALERLDARS